MASRSRKARVPKPPSSASSGITEEHTDGNQHSTLGVIVGEVSLGDNLLELWGGEGGGEREGGGRRGEEGEGGGLVEGIWRVNVWFWEGGEIIGLKI